MHGPLSKALAIATAGGTLLWIGLIALVIATSSRSETTPPRRCSGKRGNDPALGGVVALPTLTIFDLPWRRCRWWNLSRRQIPLSHVRDCYAPRQWARLLATLGVRRAE